MKKKFILLVLFSFMIVLCSSCQKMIEARNKARLELYNNISEIYGYWTLSSYADSSNHAWLVGYFGSVEGEYVDYDDAYGVRAVINLKI